VGGVCTHTYTCTHTCTHTYTHTHTHAHTHTHTYTCTHTQAHTHMHTHIHTHIHMHTHTYTHTHTHTNTAAVGREEQGWKGQVCPQVHLALQQHLEPHLPTTLTAPSTLLIAKSRPHPTIAHKGICPGMMRLSLVMKHQILLKNACSSI